jgi:hypothetical protein
MRSRAFTVVELLVAVVMLTAIIVATGKIFSTASKVASAGEATADVLQQGIVLQEQMKRDIAKICRDGYFAIQCVAVRNDVNRVINSNPLLRPPLLNPLLPDDAIVRCDQLVFFTSGNEVSARWAGPGDLSTSGGGQQSRAARVYYGHGVQFPGLLNDPLGTNPAQSAASPVRPVITGVTPAPSPVGGSGARFVPVTPWTWFDPSAHRVGWRYGSSSQATGGPRIGVNQPEARSWVLARKAVLLSDDGGLASFYPDPTDPALAQQIGSTAAPSIFGDRGYVTPSGADVGGDTSSYFQELRNRNRVSASSLLIPSPMLQSGWIDVASSDLGKIRRVISPTLRLSAPLDLAGLDYLSTMSVPWTASVVGGGGDMGMPPSWPVGPGQPGWPQGTPVTVSGANADQTTVNGFSHQRDRIMRGTFGIPAFGFLSTSVSGPSGQPPGLLGWPRAEKAVPNVDRKTDMLTSATLLTNCSSFQVDWTWEPLTGRQLDDTGRIIRANPALRIGVAPNFSLTPDAPFVDLRGFEPFASAWPASQTDPFTTIRRQPWFGFPETYRNNGFQIPKTQWIGVSLAQDPVNSMPDVQQAGEDPSLPNNPRWANQHMRRVARWIEGFDDAPQDQNARPLAVIAPWGPSVPIRVYTAVFGFNQEEGFTQTPDGFRVFRDDFTPWPTQIRITCTIHDPRLVLSRGREFQFVIDVPKRRKD